MNLQGYDSPHPNPFFYADPYIYTSKSSDLPTFQRSECSTTRLNAAKLDHCLFCNSGGGGTIIAIPQV